MMSRLLPRSCRTASEHIRQLSRNPAHRYPWDAPRDRSRTRTRAPKARASCACPSISDCPSNAHRMKAINALPSVASRSASGTRTSWPRPDIAALGILPSVDLNEEIERPRRGNPRRVCASRRCHRPAAWRRSVSPGTPSAPMNTITFHFAWTRRNLLRHRFSSRQASRSLRSNPADPSVTIV